MLDELIKEPFLGFQPQALKFLKDLSNPKNNNKVWFDKHRETYEAFLKQPMKDLIDTLAVEINKTYPDIVVNYKSIFRINKDIRFSRNKLPYKDLYSAAFAFGRIKKAEIPQFYFHFNASEFLIAGGQYSMDTDYLKKIRSAVFNNFKKYRSIVTNKTFVREFGEVQGESLTKLPKGYENVDPDKADPLLVRSLKLKQYYVYKNYKPDIVLNEKVVDVILKNITRLHDFTKFLDEATK